MQEEARLRSRDFCQRHGIIFNPHLPLIEAVADLSPPTPADVARRALVLGYLVTVGHGAPPAQVKSDLERYGLWQFASAGEKQTLQGNSLQPEEANSATWLVECVYVLAWGLGLVRLDPLGPLDPSLPTHLPIRRDPSAFLGHATLLPFDELYRACDLLYCLHWAARESALQGHSCALDLGVVQERHRAINWLAGVEREWDEISTDT